MNMYIKTTIGIIAITLGSFSIAQADEKSHKGSSSRTHNSSSQKPHNAQRQQANRPHNGYRAKGHGRNYSRPHGRSYSRPHARSSWRGVEHRRYNYYSGGYGYPHASYIAPSYYSAPAYPHSVPVYTSPHVVSGDAGAVLGGAIFGAIIGSAIALH